LAHLSAQDPQCREWVVHGPQGERADSISLGSLTLLAYVTSTTLLAVKEALAHSTNVLGPRGLPFPCVVRGDPELYLQKSGCAPGFASNKSCVRQRTMTG
jgi:hypothetical protein